MPDISMCQGTNCKIKNNCYRFTADPSKYQQSYFGKSPFNKGELLFKCTNREYCKYYWPNKENEYHDES